MENKTKYLLWGLTIVPLAALLDTAIFAKRDFVSYVFICLWEYLIFCIGMVVGESEDKEPKAPHQSNTEGPTR
jgi:hypothetical protein